MNKMFAVLPLMVALTAPAYANTVVFDCTLKDATRYTLEREDKADVWVMRIAPPGVAATEVTKSGNNMGAGSYFHAAVNTATTEIYIHLPEKEYTLSSSEHGIAISGFVQETKDGKQTAYGECEVKSFKVDFSKPGLFDNFTIVD